jgi:predicted transglutaminase-like cysteine proteinase
MIGVAAATLSGTMASAIEIPSKSGMEILSVANAPIGYVAFCAKYPRDCTGGSKPGRVTLDSTKFAELDRVNRAVNEQIAPVTDLELYKTAELWAYPTTSGDCEDYVLLKKKLLVAAGWNSSSLLITVVRDENGAGHAVLTVVTDKGDLILDNQRDGVLPWQVTPYQYVKRQSQADPKSWVYVGTADAGVGVASTR